jgi:hypothetical protein
MRQSRNLIRTEAGLLDDAVIRKHLAGYPLELIAQLRKALAAGIPGLREKLNTHLRYLGYASGKSDALFVYFQKSGLVIDARVSPARAEELRAKGIVVRPRENYQGRAGWLTGVRVPYDTPHIDAITRLAMDALRP